MNKYKWSITKILKKNYDRKGKVGSMNNEPNHTMTLQMATMIKQNIKRKVWTN